MFDIRYRGAKCAAICFTVLCHRSNTLMCENLPKHVSYELILQICFYVSKCESNSRLTGTISLQIVILSICLDYINVFQFTLKKIGKHSALLTVPQPIQFRVNMDFMHSFLPLVIIHPILI